MVSANKEKIGVNKLCKILGISQYEDYEVRSAKKWEIKLGDAMTSLRSFEAIFQHK